MGRRRCRLLVAFLTVALAAMLGPPREAAADPPPWAGKWREHRGKHHHRHYWHGYPPPYGYVAPGVYLGLPPVVIAPPPVVLTPPPIIVQTPPPRVRCRSWTGSVVIGGRVQPAYGTQCLMPDGTWQLVD